MSTAIRCDRCGAYYERGGIWLDGGDLEESYDLCKGCRRDFNEWVKAGKQELVFSDGCRDPEVTGGWPDECANDALPPESDVRGEQVDASDTRAKLEADVREFAQVYYTNHLLVYDKVISLLDRQAAITEREFFETACEGCERLGGEDDATLAEMAQRIQTLELEIAKRDKGIARLKKRRGDLTEQLGKMADRMARDGR